MKKKNVVTKLVEHGVCEVNVEEVIKQWTDKWFITQLKKEYHLNRHDSIETLLHVQIAPRQAKKIIRLLDLKPVQSYMKVWKKDVVK